MTRLLPMLEETLQPPHAENDEAGFGTLSTARGHLPLRAMDIQGRIDGLLAQVTLSQTFCNATDELLEATYIFPLPDRAAVTGFRMEVAGRVVEGVLEERLQARQDYDQAIREGRRASIAEEERPGVFTLRVGNLLPREEATVRLTLAGTLPYHEGEVTFRWPLVIAPRYIPGLPLPGPSVGDGVAVDTDAVPDASRISPPVLLPGFPNPVRLSLSVDLHDEAVAVDGVRSSLHATWTEESAGVRRITLRPGERLDRDFILRFRLGGESVRTSLSLHPDSPDSRTGTFAMTVIPPAEGEGAARRPRDVAFVLDRSGSMDGWKIVAARRALARMVDTLGADDRFCVYAFDDAIESPEKGDPRLVAATDRNRFRTVEFLARVEARGGTEMAPPLKRAAQLLSNGDPYRDRVLVLITDGQVGNEDQVLGMLGRLLDGVRVFALGIDRSVNEGFLRRLADLGGGDCELVESEERLDEVLDSIHRRIGTPVLTGLRLEPDGLEVEGDSLAPGRIPDLFAGAPLLLLGRYRGAPRGPVILHATDARGNDRRAIIAPATRENPAIASAWARGQVRKLEDRYVISRSQGDRDALERAIVETSLRYGVLCRFTAYVAIDRSRINDQETRMHRVTQPVEMPSGWSERVPENVSLLLGGSGALCAPPSAPLASYALGGAKFFRVPSPPARKSRKSKAPNVPPVDFDSMDTLGELGEPLPAPPVDLAGYDRLERFGAGGFGTVYRGHDRRRGRTVLIKISPELSSMGSPDDLVARISLLTQLNHPSIVKVFEVFRRDGCVVTIVEYVPGPTLSETLHRTGRFDPREAARLIVRLADALQHAHERGVIHGDVKTGNVLIGDDGTPRITDFGLLLSAGDSQHVAGTPTFMAPELLEGDSLSTAPTDIYSLGVIFYLLLTGVLPYRGAGMLRVIAESLRGAATPPSKIAPNVPHDLERICLKAMARDPSARYASAAEFADDLRRFLASPGSKPKPGPLGRIKQWLVSPKPTPPTASDPATNPPAPAPDPEPGQDRREGFWK